MRSLVVLGLLGIVCASWGQTVCIDPGHPSEVGVGTRGKRLTEVRVAWMVSKALKASLEKHGIKVVMTKSRENEKVLNRKRAMIANRSNADLMIRLHCDAGSGTGYAVYYPASAGTVDHFTGPSGKVVAESRVAATKLHDVMSRSLAGKLLDGGLKSDRATAVGAKQGALTGSIYSKVPVVLVEMVVLTNRADEAFIASKAGKSAMVKALTVGVLAAIGRP